MSLAMTKQERERFLADLHVGIISIPEDGRGPLTVPIWYLYEPGGELRVVNYGAQRGDRYIEKTRGEDVGNVLVRMLPERWLTVDYAKA